MLQRNAWRRTAALTLSALLLTGALAGCGAKKPASTPADIGPVTATPPPNPNQKPPETKPPTPAPPAEKPDSRPAPKLPGAVGVMVENSPQARPQAGLDRADIVYELESEWGITRFLALFYREPADKIGPVRSARLGFYDIAIAHGIPYAHAGGNNDVLVALKNGHANLLNIDEINTCGGCFWRISERKAPHNLYTSTDLLVDQGKRTGFGLKPLGAYAESSAMPGGNPGTEVTFHWGGDTQRVTWSWNGKRYDRSQSSVPSNPSRPDDPHVMESGARISADTVVLLFTSYKWDQASQWGEGQNNITITGAGSGYLLRDGQMYPIAWKKPSREAHYTLTTADGKPAPLAYGQTWFEVLKSKEHVTKGLPQ